MRNAPNFIWLVSGLALIVTISAVYLYVSKFGFGFEYISSDHEKRGQFSDFFNLFVSMASLLVLAALTWQIHKNEQKRDDDRVKDEENRERDRRQYEQWIERPVLIFKENSDGLNCKITNVGRGVAINVSMNTLFEDEVLPPGESFTTLTSETLEVRYNDVFNNLHISTFESGSTKFSFHVFVGRDKGKTVYKNRH